MDTLERRAYQLIIGRVNGEEIRIPAYRDKIIRTAAQGIGGFIIFGGEKGEVKALIREAQSVAEMPLFIASDVERGVGQQIRGCTVFPCQMALAAAVDKHLPEDVALLRDAVRAVAQEAQDIGINMPLIPVLDVNTHPENPIICTRAFSDDPEEVAWFGSALIEILEGSGLISCAKHFPGHGDTSYDSHIMLPVIEKSYQDLLATDIFPFKEAIRRGVRSIMVGHLSIPAIDDRPASLSKKVITGLLRSELGFDGLIMTDALNMNALKEIGNVPSECLNAGADILLHPADPELAVKALVSPIKAGEVSEVRVDEALNRIKRVKEAIKRFEKFDVDYMRNESISSDVSRKAISLVKKTTGILPLRDKDDHCLIFAGDSDSYESSIMKKHFRKFVSLHEIHEKSSGSGVVRPQIDCSTAIFAIFTKVSAWRGSSGLSEDDKDRILDIIRRVKRSVVVSFGSPYVLRHFGQADVLIAAYDPTERAEQAVLEGLNGRLNFRGRIPVKLEA